MRSLLVLVGTGIGPKTRVRDRPRGGSAEPAGAKAPQTPPILASSSSLPNPPSPEGRRVCDDPSASCCFADGRQAGRGARPRLPGRLPRAKNSGLSGAEAGGAPARWPKTRLLQKGSRDARRNSYLTPTAAFGNRFLGETAVKGALLEIWRGSRTRGLERSLGEAFGSLPRLVVSSRILSVSSAPDFARFKAGCGSAPFPSCGRQEAHPSLCERTDSDARRGLRDVDGAAWGD